MISHSNELKTAHIKSQIISFWNFEVRRKKLNVHIYDKLFLICTIYFCYSTSFKLSIIYYNIKQSDRLL